LKKTLLISILLAVSSTAGTAAQDAGSIIDQAVKAMGMEHLSSIVYSGSAADVNFLQTRSINGPWPLRPIANYVRAIDLTQVASRAGGDTMNQGLFGGAPVAGRFNQGITPQNVVWQQQLDYWVTPWGFLKGAAANGATVKTQKIRGKSYSVVTWSPSIRAPSAVAYRINGYVNDQFLVERVETWVDHDIFGDMHVDAAYTEYKDFGGLKVPTRFVQERGGWTFFEATITGAKANPADLAQLLQPPPPAPGRGGNPAARGAAAGRGPTAAEPQPPSTKLADGVYKINGAYNALAVEFKDYVIVVEGPQSVARGEAVFDEVKQILPSKPIRYVVNTHPHADHASGLSAFLAEGVILVTQQNNKAFLESAFGAPRTLVGDRLARFPRKPKVDGVGEKRVFKDDTRTLELYHITDTDPERVHSDGMLVAFLPKEKILFQADFTLPAPGQTPNPFVQSLGSALARLKLDFDSYVSVHNTNVPQTRADLMKAVGLTY
jgi:glyoxylase-like metal-dependent hydrolase (beta-lactamase superfamily II)